MVKLMMIGIEADSALGNDTVIIIKSWAHSWPLVGTGFLDKCVWEDKSKMSKGRKNNVAQAKPKGTKFSHYCVIDLTPLSTVCLRFRSYLYLSLPPHEFWNPIESSERAMHTLHTTAPSCLFFRIFFNSI